MQNKSQETNKVVIMNQGEYEINLLKENASNLNVLFIEYILFNFFNLRKMV